MNNRKRGTTFERELCQVLANHGFWAHNLAQNSAGQPFDVIAARNGRTHVIDCKLCSHGFALDRIEENQRNAMTLWQETGNGHGWFALETGDGELYFHALRSLDTLGETKRRLSESDIRQGYPLKKWVEMCE